MFLALFSKWLRNYRKFFLMVSRLVHVSEETRLEQLSNSY